MVTVGELAREYKSVYTGCSARQEAFSHIKYLHIQEQYSQVRQSKEMTTSNYFQFTDEEPVVQGCHVAQGHRTGKPGLPNLNVVLFLYLIASPRKDFRYLEILGHNKKRSSVEKRDTGTLCSPC